ncbi:T9SS type A sorting domain-containing protein [Flavobacterium sp.]|uniref:T9SS type A sorting domain-containing protein n=3 Tax=Flavobacterium sp. TaxID=239 RepID=UPI0040475886
MKKTLLILTLFLIVKNQAQTVTTYAGSGSYGLVNGQANIASFNSPTDLAVDSNGNVFVLDNGNHCVRKITPSGDVSTFAGSAPGNQDGQGVNAKFNTPLGMAIDNFDNLYIADTGNNKIRKIDPSGNVSSIAGYTTSGNQDGNGFFARFNSPRDLVVDVNGNIYVADTSNHRIRKISPNGDVTTFAGSIQGSQDGVGTVAKFYNPVGIAIDSNGDLFVTDYLSHRIRKITTSTADVVTFAGNNQGHSNGIGTAAAFFYPHGLAIDNNNIIYVADIYNNAVRKISPNAEVTDFAGMIEGYQDGEGVNAKFSNPYGVATDANGNIYVADTNNHRIRKITPNNLSVSDFNFNDKVILYPNPVKDVLSIQTENGISFKNYSVLDINGRVLVSQSKAIQNNQINLSGLTTGIYILQLETDKGLITKKIIKE